MREFLDNPAESKKSTSRLIQEQVSQDAGWYYRVAKTLYSGKTDFQDIELVETEEFGTTLLLDGATQVMEKIDFQYHEPMAHLALLAHPNPQRVLIIGGGDGGTLREVLKHPSVELVDFVELDRRVVEFSRRYLKTLNQGAFDDPRVHTIFTDGRAFVEKALVDGDKRWDCVIMDMTDPEGPSLLLYTVEFFKAVKGILKDESSFFVMHCESPDARPVAFARIRHTLSAAFPLVRGAYAYTRMYGAFWSFAIASIGKDPADLEGSEADHRLTGRGIRGLKLISGTSWPALFASYPYIEELLKPSGPISTDADPGFPDSFQTTPI